MFIKTPSVFIGVHQVEEYSFCDSCLFIAQSQHFLINAVQTFMLFGQHFTIKLTAIAFDFLQIPQMEKYQATDLLTGAKEEICLLPYKATEVSVGAYNGKILKITF